jgi:hypothetical protein
MSDLPQAASARPDRRDDAFDWFDVDRRADRTRRTVPIGGRPEDAGPPAPLRVVAAPASTPSRAGRVVQVQRRRPPRPPVERLGTRPDRIAMWALMMALALIAVAALSAHP